MLHPVTLRVLAVAACGWLLACDALAVSLGRARGPVLMGRSLDLSVQVTEASREAPCARTDLFYGDMRVDRGVSVRWEPAADGHGVLRVLAGRPVDEPMVTLYLRAGCGNESTRRYVFLAEPPAEVVPAAAAAPLAAAVATPQAAARTASPPRRAAAVVRTAAPASGSGGTAKSAPRLRLEPLDLGVERDPTLRLTPQLRAPEAADPQRRAQAAALWQVLQRSPDDAVQEALRLQATEREMRALGDAMRRNASTVTQLRGEVDQVGRGRTTASAAVVGLAVLLMALLVWLAWRWHRESRVLRVGRWFEANSELGQPPMPIVDAAAARRMTAPPPPSRPLPASAAAARSAAPTSGWIPAEAARAGPLRKAGVQEVVDLHDKADFFLSIGEHEQAIAMLDAHVHDQVETSPLPWLDLLALYHRFGRRAEYERLRSEFQGRFRAWAPGFDHFEQPAPSLEHHEGAVHRIAQLWPSAEVLEVIAELLFRPPELPGAEPFGREAYRDLVLLYHVARESAPQEEAVPAAQGPQADFDETAPPPDALHEVGTTTLDPLLVPPASPRVGVDIDLGEADPSSTTSQLDFDISSYEPVAAAGRKR